MHQFFPAGPPSWCGLQRVLASAQESYRARKEPLPRDIFDLIKPVWPTGVAEAMLENYTQNYKSLDVQLRLHLAHLSTAWFLWERHGGDRFLLGCWSLQQRPLLYNLQCAEVAAMPARLAVQCLEEIDNVCLSYSARNGSDKEKKAKKRQRAVRKGLIDAAVEAKGVTYALGAFLNCWTSRWTISLWLDVNFTRGSFFTVLQSTVSTMCVISEPAQAKTDHVTFFTKITFVNFRTLHFPKNTSKKTVRKNNYPKRSFGLSKFAIWLV